MAIIGNIPYFQTNPYWNKAVPYSSHLQSKYSWDLQIQPWPSQLDSWSQPREQQKCSEIFSTVCPQTTSRVCQLLSSSISLDTAVAPHYIIISLAKTAAPRPPDLQNPLKTLFRRTKPNSTTQFLCEVELSQCEESWNSGAPNALPTEDMAQGCSEASTLANAPRLSTLYSMCRNWNKQVPQWHHSTQNEGAEWTVGREDKTEATSSRDGQTCGSR